MRSCQSKTSEDHWKDVSLPKISQNERRPDPVRTVTRRSSNRTGSRSSGVARTDSAGVSIFGADLPDAAPSRHIEPNRPYRVFIPSPAIPTRPQGGQDVHMMDDELAELRAKLPRVHVGKNGHGP
jgi:hypothetical protein